MNTNLSHDVQSRAHLNARFDAPDAARPARTTVFTCTIHSEIVRDEPNKCPHCGATLIPTRQAIVRAAMALRSLSAATRALRLYPL